MKKIVEILRAWKNWISPTNQIKEIARERKAICDACPFKQNVELMGGIDVCGKCHCPIEPKSHSPENSCPMGKWKR